MDDVGRVFGIGGMKATVSSEVGQNRRMNFWVGGLQRGCQDCVSCDLLCNDLASWS